MNTTAPAPIPNAAFPKARPNISKTALQVAVNIPIVSIPDQSLPFGQAFAQVRMTESKTRCMSGSLATVQKERGLVLTMLPAKVWNMGMFSGKLS
jgi:hypothetical protein